MSTPIFTLQKSEFYERTNPKREYHDSDAYSNNSVESVDSLMKFLDGNDKLTHKTLNRFKANGLRFKLVQTKEDLANRNYSKRGLDQDGQMDYVRDENGDLIPLTYDEKLEMIKRNGWERFQYEHRIYDEQSGKCVANTQDEYGCLLFIVSDEFKGFGFGQKLMDADFAFNGYRHSGGYTPSGQKSTDLFYDSQIRKAMANGEFSKMVRSGEKSIEYVKDLLNSANVQNWYKNISKAEVEKYPDYYNKASLDRNGLTIEQARQCGNFLPAKHSRCQLPDQKNQTDFSFGAVKDMLLYNDGNSAVLYDKKFLKLAKDQNHISKYDSRFLDDAILGYVYIGGVYDTNETPKLYGFYAKNPALEKFMHSVALNLYEGDKFRVTPEQRAVIRSLGLEGVSETQDLEKCYVSLQGTTLDVKRMGEMERIVSKIEGDRYGEAHMLMRERAYALSEGQTELVRFYKPTAEELKDKPASTFESLLLNSVSSEPPTSGKTLVRSNRKGLTLG